MVKRSDEDRKTYDYLATHIIETRIDRIDLSDKIKPNSTTNPDCSTVVYDYYASLPVVQLTYCTIKKDVIFEPQFILDYEKEKDNLINILAKPPRMIFVRQ